MRTESAATQKEGRGGATALRIRALTATALFDGHDASINLVRRLLQEAGVEVVHLGHDRSVREIVQAAIQEDVHLVAVSSYQGGHNYFFPYLRRELDAAGAPEIKIFGGGGGVILPSEVRTLEASGVQKIFTPEDARRLGHHGMVEAMLSECRPKPLPERPTKLETPLQLARALSSLELGVLERGSLESDGASVARVVGLTGPGGAGKSSLLDELVLRFRRDFPALRMGVLCVDPSKRRSGGALLGDRLRMNSVADGAVFLRSFATRGGGAELSPAIRGAIELLSRAGYSLVLVETAGIGQGASAVLEVAPTSVYVMTPEFGAPTQLEKIDMLDFADLVAVNKLDRRGGQDAVEQVIRQLRRGGYADAEQRVFGTAAGQFGDPGVEALYRGLVALLARRGAGDRGLDPAVFQGRGLPERSRLRIVPADREAYLAEAARTVRAYHEQTERDAAVVRRLDGARMTLDSLIAAGVKEDSLTAVRRIIADAEAELSPPARQLLEGWEETVARYGEKELGYRVRGRDLRAPLRRASLSGLQLSRVALPRFRDRSEILRFLRRENLPGEFPFTAAVFALRREDEQPTRQFAGEGPPERTNRRFHLLCRDQSAIRLSTAFDSVTLYGRDPDERPDIFGKIGESGVSIATLDDMRRLFEGFDLGAPSTSVSMTINGPAPAILAMFFNVAIDQQLDRFRESRGREASPQERQEVRDRTLRSLRGTVQADILKEDQAQNTCIFSTAFALRLMGDVQEYFIDRDVRNFYSVSISGYHIAEAGANPVTQLAFTLANGLTYVEYYLARNMDIDAFAANFSFFFSMGLDPEYSVLGRVARRIWAVVLRERYGAAERAQKLKYHVQTSGRSLHAREVAFNDIRTTLQALMAYYDRCNSLHTNAYDEAVTTPTEESVRRALAIQLIIQKELGFAANENPLQGSFVVEELTDLVEEAVLSEFERIAERGGVLGAMESGYLRSKIQEESRVYEETKQSGERPIIGVNTFLGESESEDAAAEIPVVRATEEEKRLQIRRLEEFQERHREEAVTALARLKELAAGPGNTFEALMDVVRCASLGQITQALFEVGGAYRRMM